MTEIQKEKYRAAARERKRKSHVKITDQKKLTLFRNSFFRFKENQEQNIKNFKLFQSNYMFEEFMRCIRSHLRLWQIKSTQLHIQQENSSLVKNFSK